MLGFLDHGAKRARTADLLGAIQIDAKGCLAEKRVTERSEITFRHPDLTLVMGRGSGKNLLAGTIWTRRKACS